MPNLKNPNPVKVRYDRAALEDILIEDGTIGPKRAAAILDAYERSRAEGQDKPCQSLVFHGPGHQSSTYCQSRGEHSQHYADLPSGGYAEWTDDDPYLREW